MRRVIVGIVIVIAASVAACSQQAQSVTGPSGLVGVPSINQLASATVTVLDGTTWVQGAYKVTKWPNSPTVPPSPYYWQQIASQNDPCALKWAGYETNYIIDVAEDGVYDEFGNPDLSDFWVCQ